VLEGDVSLGNLSDRKRGSRAATQDTYCKFRSQFAANAVTFNLVRTEEEFLKRPDPREHPDHKNERLRCF